MTIGLLAVYGCFWAGAGGEELSQKVYGLQSLKYLLFHPL